MKPPPSWTTGQRIAAGVCVAWLALQLALPMLQLFQPRPARFGWQMYSGFTPHAKLSVITSDSIIEVDPDQFVVRPRLDFVAADLPGHLCSRVSGATTIRMSFENQEPEEVPCR